jgi:predicted transposase/invertase (TIGR01784 family)
MKVKAKYVNPFTDFGFKKLFGEEASKPVLLDFLRSLLPKANIADLSFKDKEKLGDNEADRKAVYDIYCENTNGEKIIVELQKAKQNYFKDRTIYYATFPIQEQAEKGQWDYKLQFVYCIGILDFTFEDKTKKNGEVLHTVVLKDQNNKVFYEKLMFVYLEMPHFTKTEQQLVTRLDKWLYFIKNLENLEVIPDIFKDDVFNLAFDKAEIAKYTPDERDDYEKSLKVYRDLKNVIDTAFDEGKAEGIAEGKAEGIAEGKAEGIALGEQKGLQLTAKIIKLYTRGFDAETIAEKLQTEIETVNIAIAEYEAE